VPIADVFKTQNLTATVNAIKTVKTPVLDKVFGNKIRSLSSHIEFDIETDAEGIQSSVPSGSPAKVINKDGFDHVVVEAPRFPEKFSIKPSDLDRIRQMGGEGQVVLSQKVGRELAKLKARTDRTREFMAVKALSGKVVDGSNKSLIDFSFPTANKPALTGTALWSDADSDPVKNLRAWKKLIMQGTGGAVDKFVAFCGSDVMDALLENAKVLDLMKYQKGSQLAEQGRITGLAGVEIEELLSSYKASGTRTDMIPANYIALVGVGFENAAEMFAPVEDFKAPNGIGKGKAAGVFFSKSWETEDPSVRWVKAEARPLPVIMRPGCIVWAKVL
jgi:hypothetical protein